ncbi:type II toxin-antitoxin system prevent-host-death family antitoxin [candidate division KSB1 bacterium]|jgi:prevent-host-death family protein|nr:type II toxin-antitoxin system prevent-host-death family antitoxin [candidate division KSB1 bacterium]
MDTIAVSELRANLMSVLKEIQHGSSVNITSRGVVVAKLVPPDYSQENARKKLLEIGKSAKIGDIVSPIDTQWEALN